MLGSFCQSGNVESAHHAAHLLRYEFIGSTLGVADGRQDKILQHIHVLFGDDFGIDCQTLHLFDAVHDDGDHSPTCGRLYGRLFQLLLQVLLHLLRLLHHLLNVHNGPSHLLNVFDLGWKNGKHGLHGRISHGLR